MLSCAKGAQCHRAGKRRNSVWAFRSKLSSPLLPSSSDGSGSGMGSRAPPFPPLGLPLSSLWNSQWKPHGVLSQSRLWFGSSTLREALIAWNSTQHLYGRATFVKAQKMFITSLPWSNECLWALRNRRETTQEFSEQRFTPVRLIVFPKTERWLATFKQTVLAKWNAKSCLTRYPMH